jgi:hypothetical protein
LVKSWVDFIFGMLVAVYMSGGAARPSASGQQEIPALGNNPTDAKGCVEIRGEFEARGISRSPIERSITIFQALRRPAQPAVMSFRVEFDPVRGLIRIESMNRDGLIDGAPIEMAVTCVNRGLEMTSKFAGSADGVAVEGSRHWRFSTDGKGGFEIELSESGRSGSLPGTRQNFGGRVVSTFPLR